MPHTSMRRPLAAALTALLGLLGAARARADDTDGWPLPPPWPPAVVPIPWPTLAIPTPWPAPAPEQAPYAPEDGDADIGSMPLDSVSREVDGRGRLRCPEVELVRYSGHVVQYRGGVRANPAFRERLRRFEEIVRDVAIEVYGRAPSRMLLLGSYSCRRIRRIESLVSEHAFGNAIDVSGFEFDAEREPSSSREPRLARRFRVSVAREWNADRNDPVRGLHARFLHTLIDRLLATPRLFRVLIGPADPDHWNHFHLDCAPYRYVRI